MPAVHAAAGVSSRQPLSRRRWPSQRRASEGGVYTQPSSLQERGTRPHPESSQTPGQPGSRVPLWRCSCRPRRLPGQRRPRMPIWCAPADPRELQSSAHRPSTWPVIRKPLGPSGNVSLGPH